MTRAWRGVFNLGGLAVLLWALWHLLQWGGVHAVWQADADACQALSQAGVSGACWGVVPAKAWPILMGHYPDGQGWRPVLMVGLSLAMLAAWALVPAPWRLRAWAFAGVVWLPLSGLLMHGGVAALPVVPSADWGGLPLTLLLFLGAWWLSWPVAVLLALARQQRGLLGVLATAWIEVIRGVPLITLLLACVLALPLILPEAYTPSVFLRAGLALLLFSSAYLAEVLRGGLQTVAEEQVEAGTVLGLGYWGIQRRIVLPQALRIALPGMTGHAIGLLKDTSLVVVVGLHELTGGLSLTMAGDPIWRPHQFEAYLFVGLIYALLCLGLSWAGRRLERRWLR